MGRLWISASIEFGRRCLFVTDWCGNSPEQKAAIRACKAALAGDIDAETARGIVIQFAKKKDILAEEGMSPSIVDSGQQLHI